MIIFLLCVWGMTNIISNENIFLFFRLLFKGTWFGKMISCSTCCSFWCGMILSLFFTISIVTNPILNVFLMGCMSSGVVNIIEHIKIKIGF